MKTRFFFVICALVMLGASSAWADGPDKVVLSAISTNPASTPNGNGEGRNVTLSSNVAPGDTIVLTFTVGATTSNKSGTIYSDLVLLTSSTNVKPAGAADVSVSGLANCTFASAATTCSESVTLKAPSTPGAYQVLIDADDERKGNQGPMAPDFFFLNFNVAVPGCSPAATTLVVGQPACTLYHANSVVLTATLKSGNTPLVGKTITFNLPGGLTGTAVTDVNGVATYNYNPTTLRVGDYPISASWQSDNACYQNPAVTGNVLGIQYLFIGFQQPINADGSSIFNGKVIPIKIKLADANGAVVPDAYATVYVDFGTPAIVGLDTENVASSINFDSGNLMRYDSTANQYVFNWDTSTVQIGTNTVRVFLQEGSCADPRQVVISLGKKK